MTMIIALPPEIERQLHERAQACGQSVDGLALRLIEEALHRNGSAGTEQAEQTFDEILAPVRQGFAESGLSEAELDALFEEAREEVWQERQKEKGGP